MFKLINFKLERDGYLTKSEETEVDCTIRYILLRKIKMSKQNCVRKFTSRDNSKKDGDFLQKSSPNERFLKCFVRYHSFALMLDNSVDCKTTMPNKVYITLSVQQN